MLVLSRKPGESIQIDDDIFVTVAEVRGGRVRLAISAPRHVRIVRKEILERDFEETPEHRSEDLSCPPSVLLN
ncbi:MAG: carbon storage regulator CsrA [Fuerstiella sp.]